ETEDGAVAGLSQVDLIWLATRAGVLLLIGSLALTFFRGRASQALEAAAIWLVIALGLAIGYTYRVELGTIADRVLSELVPGHAATRGQTVEVARGNGGNFAVVAQINGARVVLVLDTGASSVVLTQEAAKAAGLPLEVLSYSVAIETANGRARAAPVTLD